MKLYYLALVSLSTVQAALNEHVKAILNEELKALQGDAKDWREYNKAFLARNKPKSTRDSAVVLM